MIWNRRGLAGFFDKLIEIWCWCWYGIADRIRLWLARREKRATTDLVSIIMPTIGRDATKAIQSVLNQTYKNWELIIVFDGITLGYDPYCIFKDHRIKLFEIPKKLHYPNQPIYQWLVGPVNAINYGLSKVRGAWIARVDDDDVWIPTHLEDMLYGPGEFKSGSIRINGEIPSPYSFSNCVVGAVQSWLYRSYLNCFKCSKHSWRWRPGNNDIDLPKRMARAGVRMEYFYGWPQADVWPRPGLKNVGKRGWLEECSQKNRS